MYTRSKRAAEEPPSGGGGAPQMQGQAVAPQPVGSGVGTKRKGGSSRYLGVCWHRGDEAWHVKLWVPQTKRERSIGFFTSEEDAARAFDFAAVKEHGAGAKRNFPTETISAPPVSLGEKRKSSASAGTSPSRHGTFACTTRRPSAGGTLGATPRRRTLHGRTTSRLWRRTDRVPSATSRPRRSARRL
jgi:hypothetical protein